jgi:chromate transporter
MKLGFISFGGPAGQIAIMHEFLVEKKKWISESRFLHALNYAMILPGPEAQQLATYTGWLLHGTRGGLVAGIFFILPSMFILLGLSMLYVTFGNIPWVYAMFNGLKPAVIAIVLLALIKIGGRSITTAFHAIFAVAAFVCIFFLDIPFPAIIISALMIAAISRRVWPSLFKRTAASKTQQAADESGYYINANTVMPDAGFRMVRVAKQVGIAALIWVLPFTLFYHLTADFAFWK